jgi:NTE family protein
MSPGIFEHSKTPRDELAELLAEMPLFSGLSPAVLDEVAAAAEWLSLPGGAVLFSEGDSADALYVVLSGSLAVLAADGRVQRRFLARLTAGDTVGEMGLISGHPRTANVVALRNTELARISGQAFNEVLRRDPQTMWRMAQLMVSRLERMDSPPRAHVRGACTFTVLPQSLEVDFAGFSTALVKALGQFGRTELVWNARAGSHTSQWFNNIESANDFVVYVAEPTPNRWTKLCERQADALLLLARAESPAGSWAALRWPHDHSLTPQRWELILAHDSAIETGAAARWLANLPDIPHHHVQSAADFARLARMLTGRAVGLVLSGGGARGFAHIGAVKALREAGIPIDLLGGTSMGGILGAGVAARWGVQELTDRFRHYFVESRPLRDYTLPFVSLVSGHKVSRMLFEAFGELAIEDLPLAFFCISSNLTAGHVHVHRRGELWRALRASVAVPGVLPPVVHDGDVLVDGGAMNNLPVDIMLELGRGPVIGCDAGADRAFTTQGDDLDVPLPWQLMRWIKARRHLPNIFQILWRAGMVNSSALSAAQRDRTDLVLRPPLAEIDMLNWKAFERAIQAGYEYTARCIDGLPEDSPLWRSAGMIDG